MRGSSWLILMTQIPQLPCFTDEVEIQGESVPGSITQLGSPEQGSKLMVRTVKGTGKLWQKPWRGPFPETEVWWRPAGGGGLLGAGDCWARLLCLHLLGHLLG